MKSTRGVLLAVFFAVALVCAAEEEPHDACLRPCHFDYRPVCGTKADGTKREFGNQCDYDIYNCQHPNEYPNVVEGRCA